MHYDMDAFYASAELRERPELVGKPIVVGGGVICTASYEARKYGVKSAMPVFMAKKLCPSLVVLPVNHELYHKISDEIHELIRKITKKVEFIALDEGYLDITEIIKKYPSKEYFAKKFRERILKKTGLSCSVGIGYNKLTAKIASDMLKPGGIFIFKNSEEFINWAKEKQVRVLPGIGNKFEKELMVAGLEKISDIYKITYYELEKKYSQGRAQLLYYYSRGIDDSEVKNYRKAHSIGTENSYRFSLESEESVRKELEEVFKKVYERMIEEGYFCKTLVLKLKYKDLKQITRSISLNTPTNDRVVLYDMYETLFSAIGDYTEIRLVGLSVTNLVKTILEQLKLIL